MARKAPEKMKAIEIARKWRWNLCSFLLFSLCFLPSFARAEETSPTLRLITCAPNLTEMIFELGLGPQVVGVSTYTAYPPEAMKLPPVADLVQPNLEAMVALRPTHIVALRSNGKVRDFFRGRLGVKVIEVGELETFAQIDAAVLELGKAFGREATAQAWLGRQPSIEVDCFMRRPALFVLSYGPGLTQLYAIGRGTYLNELLESGCYENVLPESLGRYPVLSKEAILRYNPEVIFVSVDAAQLSARQLSVPKDFAVLASIKAVRSKAFHYVSDPGIMIPGPRARFFARAFQESPKTPESNSRQK